MSAIDRAEQHIEFDERYERTTLASDYRSGEQDSEDRRVDQLWASMTEYAVIEVESDDGSRVAFVRVADGVVCVDPITDYRYAYCLDPSQSVTSVVEEFVDDVGSDRVGFVCGRGRVARRVADVFSDDDEDDE